ncbi:MAG: hypothetical protein K9M82_09480 [Deltaproteobacteria bacterium]|nr:hypothetical protein [Deltaproteobacteria bacterium]
MDSHETRERFKIRVSERGLEILCYDGGEVTFSAAEALMLLDILRHEESQLTQLAEAASPLPMRIRHVPE